MDLERQIALPEPRRTFLASVLAFGGSAAGIALGFVVGFWITLAVVPDVSRGMAALLVAVFLGVGGACGGMLGDKVGELLAGKKKSILASNFDLSKTATLTRPAGTPDAITRADDGLTERQP